MLTKIRLIKVDNVSNFPLQLVEVLLEGHDN